MKVGFFTTQINAAASDFYWNGMKLAEEVTFYDPNIDLRQYDIMLVMTYDHQVVKQIKDLSPKTKVGLIDPRNFKVLDSAKECDFLIVDSIEMEDYWAKLKKPIHRYVEYPSFNSISKSHQNNSVTRIGYHGNQIHLKSMSKAVTPALENLGNTHKLELVVVYNGPPPTGKEEWYPKNVKVTHVPWSPDVYKKTLSQCDIGISPNRMPFEEEEPFSHDRPNEYNYSPDDYILRFKMPTNPGRIIVFGKLGIPVVADFYPSAFQTLNNDRGFVCHSSSAWEKSLKSLIENTDLRRIMSKKLQDYVESKFNFEHQNVGLIQFLRTIM